jgi:hypothetical protein
MTDQGYPRLNLEEVKVIVFVPQEGDPLGLVKDGEHGDRPPRMSRLIFGGREDKTVQWRSVGARDLVLSYEPPKVNSYYSILGLLLLYKGIPVQMGLWILTATIACKDRPELLSVYSKKQANQIAQLAQTCGMGTVVYLDAENREIEST